MLGCKPMETPLEGNSFLSSKVSKNDELLTSITQYQKLIYLTLTKPDISCDVQTIHAFSSLVSC